MAKSSAETGGNPGTPSMVRIVVAGEKDSGKSSLIVAAAMDSYPTNVPPVLPQTKLPKEFYPDRIPITVIDTSSRPEDRGEVAEELKQADVVVLAYACNQPQPLEGLSDYWLPELRQLGVNVPVIVVGCKLDLRDDHNQVSLEQVMSPMMQRFREIETCIECSAYKHIQKAVIHPTGPLFDQESQTLKPWCIRALKRIFILCDHDRDGVLSDAELNDFQVKCFNAALQPSEIVDVKRVVQEKLPEGVNENGLTLTGFLFLHALFIEKGRLEIAWTVLRKFGYNNDVKLANELIPQSLLKRTPDQSVELTNEATEFLRGIYELFDNDADNNLRPHEVDDLFSTAPERYSVPYVDAAEKTTLGGLSINGFLSLWALMTLLDPARSLEYLIYIGYPADLSSAVRITWRRRLDSKKQRSERNVFQCFVFGPKNAGKSALLNSLIGRSAYLQELLNTVYEDAARMEHVADGHIQVIPYSDTQGSAIDDRYAVNVVDKPGKTLALQEIPEDGVKRLLSTKESLAACDVVVVLYDSSDMSSWKRATELLVEVATHCENTGFEVPCLMVAAKDDLDSFPASIKESTRITQDMGLEAPMAISSKLGDFSSFLHRILSAAEHPHLSIPETEAGRSRKQHRRRINRSLMVVSVGAAAAIVGLAAYRVYAARKNASG